MSEYAFKTVMLIEDDRVTNLLNSKLIQSTKFAENIIICENGQLGLEKLRSLSDEEVPDIILLDINMPVLDGFGFMQEMDVMECPAKGCAVVIFMLSTSLNEDDHIKANSFEKVSGFLNKPLTKEVLAKIVEENKK